MKGIFNLVFSRIQVGMVVLLFILTVIIMYQSNRINNFTSKQNTEFVLEAKLTIEQNTANELKALKDLIDDESVSKEIKEMAASLYTNIVVARNNETKIETILKNKGYEEVLSFIYNNRVSVVVINKKLTEKQLNEIRDVVYTITKIKDIEIEIR